MKSILVTGAYGNLGRAVVEKFLGGGCRVIGTIAPGEKTDPPISHNEFESVVVDLADETATREFIEKSFPVPPDAAVLTVGGFAVGGLVESTLSAVQKMVTLNFETAFNTARPVFNKMLSGGSGRIFLIGARPALDANQSKGMFAYGLSKSMVLRLAEMINLEAKGTDVTATVIIPSTIDTPQNRAAMQKSDPGKWVRPEAIAEMIHFYCTEKAGAVREAVVKMYGGS